MTVSVEKQIWKEESCKENRERKSTLQKKKKHAPHTHGLVERIQSGALLSGL